ncbi:NfeD family protein [Geminicoccus flavidas]|uniref:NfeD family protein n=1 Tax=Geminicoccus flavidas TaxID=2506407 RepID=UPI001359133C|nr:NfeD family protein [Geminicoccus flavidas]
MEAWQWAAIAGMLLLLELATPGFFFAWLAVAAAVVAAVAWWAPQLVWQVQALVFALAAALAVLAWFRFRPEPAATAEPGLNRRGEALVGSRLVLDQPIQNGRGRVRIGDTSWPVSGPDLSAGTAVRVVRVDGNRLVVAAE